jgi:peptidoglycan/xylan/chitin deacetylase (PgdA/CDA1 family)
MPPAFWELWNGETEVGCTIHRVEAGLDTGAVVAEATTPIHPFSTLRGLQLTLDEIGVELMCDAVAGIRAGTLAFRSQGPGGRTNRKPTLGQVAQLRHRMAAREKARAGLAHRSAKYAYLLTRLLVGRVRNAIAKPPITVILYHRVGDALRDSLTTGIEQFDRQMALIERTCHPLSIEDVVSGRLPHSPKRPMVCVTFDDGYRDNFAIAAPILLRHRIPAAFFVSTGIVGTSRPFPHDRGKVPAALENMSWDELRQLSRCGFVIGSHTVNHIDCAAASADTVERELRTSLATLRSELGLRDVILAYPFGGREHMTPERLELVKRAGYAGCLSAYGGFNRGEVDRFNVLRCGVNWGFSDLAFRCRIFGIL